MSDLIERLEEAEAACLDMDQEIIADEDFADLFREAIESLKQPRFTREEILAAWTRVGDRENWLGDFDIDDVVYELAQPPREQRGINDGNP